MTRVFSPALVWLAIGATPRAADNLDELKRQFDYDPKEALDVKEALLYERDGAMVYDVSYTSPKGGRMTAYPVVPAGKGPHAGLVFGHWGPGDRTEFLPEAKLYATAGAVSLLIDYRWVRPAQRGKKLKFLGAAETDHAAFVQAVLDLRRGFDLLAARPDVVAKRLAYVGHSCGAQWGAASPVSRGLARPRRIIPKRAANARFLGNPAAAPCGAPSGRRAARSSRNPASVRHT
jgi:cephalosporin-C deacetylase-like acetyl esterase